MEVRVDRDKMFGSDVSGPGSNHGLDTFHVQKKKGNKMLNEM